MSMGRILGLLCVAVACCALSLPALPQVTSVSRITGLLAAMVALLAVMRRGLAGGDASKFKLAWWLRGSQRLMLVLLVGAAMMTWVVWRADFRLQDQLDPSLEDVVSRVVFRIESMVRDQSDSVRFTARVLDPTARGVPRDIEVVWRTVTRSEMPRLVPGQVWRAALILRAPRGLANPHGFDYEGYAFARNVRAIGRVRGTPVWQRDEPFAGSAVVVGRIRQALRARMRQHLDQRTYGAVLIALAIGDQDSVRPEHWRIFNLTGITHLVSISGSHVTMIAAIGGLLLASLGRRLRLWGRLLCEWIPARVMAATAAVFVGFCYCVLAGWGVPARRTFFMLLVVCGALILRLPVSVSGVLCFAACILLVLDPWAPLATGFWLSFGAVAVLFSAAQQALGSHESTTTRQRLWAAVKQASRLQWLITVAMTPALAFLFQQVSLTSPFANALAIPVVTFIVTPLALLVALLSVIPALGVLTAALAWLGHAALSAVLVPITWLAQGRWSAFDVAAMPMTWLLGALFGTAWALLPLGIPVRWTGWCVMLPALAWQPPRPDHGDWTLTALDVGQGAAVLVRTSAHNLLFDTGPTMGQTNAGERVVIPVLRAFGIRALDALVLSHADSDHIGGLRAVDSYFSVRQRYASFDLPARLHEGARRCAAGDTWHWDGVIFTFLHPELARPPMSSTDSNAKRKFKTRKNARSCVLKISGRHHTVLLPGDLPAQQERTLVHQYAGALRADVVIAPHHGSASSSSAEFVRATQAQHAIALVGYRNRFGHPDLAVQRRWHKAGAMFWRSDLQGALTVRSKDSKLTVERQRDVGRRYWHPERN